jgi:uncharacterized protein YeaO (DUF488 family)
MGPLALSAPCARPLRPVGGRLDDSADPAHQLHAALTDARETGVLSPERLRTSCVYDSQPLTSYCLAVMRFDPRRSGRRQTPIHAWWPELARSVPLLTGYRQMDAHGQRHVQWPVFASRYLAELGRVPTHVLLAFLELLNTMSCRYTTVTLLCCEHATAGDEHLVRCHRRLLKAWLLGTTDTLPELARTNRNEQ